MRDIKFRAWDKIQKILKHDILFSDDDCFEYMPNNDNTWSGWVTSLDNVELMQYTGLKDKNGVEIYEGDIVKYVLWGNEYETWTEDRIDFIEFKDGEFYPRPISNMCEDGWYSDGLKDFEVIGNIYENKELLEQ
jgi:uncharacterized phage protein (TIGR01671 family)